MRRECRLDNGLWNMHLLILKEEKGKFKQSVSLVFYRSYYDYFESKQYSSFKWLQYCKYALSTNRYSIQSHLHLIESVLQLTP